MTRSTKLPTDAVVGDVRFREWIKEKIESRVHLQKWVDVEFPATPDTEIRVRHKLGIVPTGWQIIRLNAAGLVYQDDTSPIATREFIWLKSDTASLSARIQLF